jgi:hypothetical protein
VLDYHKGAHDLTLSLGTDCKEQVLEVVEHSTPVQFTLCVPDWVNDIRVPLPLQPGRLCDDF